MASYYAAHYAESFDQKSRKPKAVVQRVCEVEAGACAVSDWLQIEDASCAISSNTEFVLIDTVKRTPRSYCRELIGVFED